jgi:hypothetical protein
MRERHLIPSRTDNVKAAFFADEIVSECFAKKKKKSFLQKKEEK